MPVDSNYKDETCRNDNISVDGNNRRIQNGNNHDFTISHDDNSHHDVDDDDLSPPVHKHHAQIDEIVLVGGSSRMPCLRAAIRRGCGRLGYHEFSLDHGINDDDEDYGVDDDDEVVDDNDNTMIDK